MLLGRGGLRACVWTRLGFGGQHVGHAWGRRMGRDASCQSTAALSAPHLEEPAQQDAGHPLGIVLADARRQDGPVDTAQEARHVGVALGQGAGGGRLSNGWVETGQGPALAQRLGPRPGAACNSDCKQQCKLHHSRTAPTRPHAAPSCSHSAPLGPELEGAQRRAEVLHLGARLRHQLQDLVRHPGDERWRSARRFEGQTTPVRE